jgi:antitoxin component YwqK of YwqJK toxin-antitoxin module
MRTLILFSVLAVVACSAPSTEEGTSAEAPKHAPVNRDSLRDGMHRYQDAEGHKLMTGEIRDSLRHGIWTTYHGNGKVMSRSEYVNGVLQGPTVVFRENGALYYDGQYRNGKQVGSWRFYGDSSQVERTVEYDTAGALINKR